MTARIEEVEESYDAEGQSINVTFGKAELTIAQKLKSEFSQVRTSLGARQALLKCSVNQMSGLIFKNSQVVS